MAQKKRAKPKAKSLTTGVNYQAIKALGHPIRTEALAILNERIASPSELAVEMNASVSVVAYHIRCLREAGFVELVRTVPVRGTVQHFYRATKRALLPDEIARSLPLEVQHGIAVRILGEIVDDIATSLADGTFDGREERHLSWTPLVLDEEGWQGLAALLAETLERAFTLQAEASERLAQSKKKPRMRATLALMGFESARDDEKVDGGQA